MSAMVYRPLQSTTKTYLINAQGANCFQYESLPSVSLVGNYIFNTWLPKFELLTGVAVDRLMQIFDSLFMGDQSSTATLNQTPFNKIRGGNLESTGLHAALHSGTNLVNLAFLLFAADKP